MIYLHNFKAFNEGLFSDYDNDNEISNEIANKLNTLKYDIEYLDNYEYLVKNLKLDENPGTYDISSNRYKLIISYYKNNYGQNTLIFKKELDCLPNIKAKIFDLLATKYNKAKL
jgi:hypothetical protein